MRIRRIDIEGTPEELGELDLTALVADEAAEEATPGHTGAGGTDADAMHDAELKKLIERHGP